MVDGVTDASPAVRRAASPDLGTLLRLHGEFCAADGHSFDEARAAAGMQPLLDDDQRGVIWLVETSAEGGTAACGYAVVTWGWSIEAGGSEALLDEIYVTRRGTGLGSLLLAHVVADARRRSMTRIFLETERENDGARSWYARRGFVTERSVWMNLHLSRGV